MNSEKHIEIDNLKSQLAAVTEESPDFCRICREIGKILSGMHILDEAEMYYRRALKVAVRKNDRVEEAKLLSNLAIVSKQLGKYHESLEQNLKSLAILESNQDYTGDTLFYASVIGNTGLSYHGLSILDSAYQYFLRALKLHEQLEDIDGIAKLNTNIGLLLADMGDNEAALESLKKALSYAKELSNKRQIVSILSSIANVYYLIEDLENAIEFNNNALAIAIELNAKDYQAAIMGNIGVLYMKQDKYESANEYYNKSLSINLEIGKMHGVIIQYTNLCSAAIGEKKYERALECITQAVILADESNLPEQISLAHGGLGVLYAEQEFSQRDVQQSIYHLELAISTIENHGLTLQNGEYYKKLAEIYAELGDGMKAFNLYKQYGDLRERLFNEQVTYKAKQFGFERKLTAEKARTQEHENILHKTFPTEIAQRLLANETFIADYYESVSVLFMDVVNFTQLASKVTPKMIVNLLNIIFTKADEVMNEFGLEKIKTIGDAYMAICGAPVPQHDHVERTANAALKLRDEMAVLSLDFTKKFKSQELLNEINKLKVRIGVHCGEAVGGVIGREKLAYDLWGDAVNTAARMESHGVAGKIHTSEDFVKSLQDSKFTFIERGETDIKGKGKMKTYFLERAVGKY
ncbi:MAG: tetratricopeptide repeat protein [Ignavibacteriae bacterium]|nr:tetratricopeptide repeat protein [Ignavibacteriota bacterium]